MIMIILIGILFFIMVALVYYFTLLITIFFEAPFIPTGQKEIARIFEAVAIEPGHVFYELGSGDGRVVRAAALRGARAIGIERSLPLVLWSRVMGSFPRHGSPGSQLQGSSSGPSQESTLRGKPADAPDAAKPGSRVSGEQNKQGSLKFIKGSFYTADLRDADVIFCYLFPETMARLKEKFIKELKPGTRIISRAFKIAGWTPVKRLQFHRRSPPIYLYIR